MKRINGHEVIEQSEVSEISYSGHYLLLSVAMACDNFFRRRGIDTGRYNPYPSRMKSRGRKKEVK